MTNDYTELEVILPQLKKELRYDQVIDWDEVLESATRIGNFVGYFIKTECCWLLTDYFTGVCVGICFSDKLTDKQFWSVDYD